MLVCFFLETSLCVIVNTLTRLTFSGVDCFIYKLLKRLGVSEVTVTFVLAVLFCFVCVANRVESYRYCEYTSMANASNRLTCSVLQKSSRVAVNAVDNVWLTDGLLFDFLMHLIVWCTL